MKSNINKHIFKITLISCVVSIVSGTLYFLIVYGAVNFVSAALCKVLCIISSIIVLWQSISLFVGILKEIFEKRPRTYREFPKFRMLATDMGVKLNKKHPFVVEKGLDDMAWNFRENRLKIGEVLLHRLSKRQRIAVVIHEFTHARKRFIFYNWQYIRMSFIIISTLLLLAVANLITYEVTRLPVDFIAAFVVLSTFLLLFITISHWNEYEADRVACDKTSKRICILALEKLKPTDRRNDEQLLHPSINQRIAKVSKVQG